jgi:NAD(P)-dependent dehydrogenase (short-subunit alcohol dehydrogenase family)
VAEAPAFRTDPYAVENGCRRYEGRVAIVTGAAQGLGRVVAKRLAEEAGSVGDTSEPREKVDRVAKGLSGRDGSEGLASAGVNPRSPAWRKSWSRWRSGVGSVDTLVNAAVLIRVALVGLHRGADAGSVDGNWWTLARHEAAPQTIERGHGRMSTSAAAWPLHYHSAAVPRFGVGKGSHGRLHDVPYTEVIKDGITVNCVCRAPSGPTATATHGTSRVSCPCWTPPEVVQARRHGRRPGHERLTPAEVAARSLLGAPVLVLTGRHFGASGVPLA